MKKLGQKSGLKWINEYFDNEDYIILKISKPETKESYDVFIDKDDFEKVYQGQWYVANTRRGSRLKPSWCILWSKKINGKKCNYNIYQYILNTKYKNIIIDHINTNRFDNRKSNLRIVDAKINRINQPSKGYCKRNNKYSTHISVDGKSFYSQPYNSEDIAFKRYIQANVLCGRDKISEFIKQCIKELNIALSKEDVENDLFLFNLNKLCLYYNDVIFRGENNLAKYYTTNTISEHNETTYYNKCNRGYRYEEKTNKYLVRISINGKHVNIGRYKTEQEANNMYLKACILLNYDKISIGIKKRILENNITISEKDYNNKYIKKIIAIRDGNYNQREFNGRYNNDYSKHIDIIVKLRDGGLTWGAIAKNLRENNVVKTAKGETIKKYYDEFMKNKILN